MARRTKKQRGALVSLPARKNSGLGMIIDIKTQNEAKLVYEAAIHPHRDRRSSDKDRRLSAAFGYYSRDGTGKLYAQRKYAYVQWIKKPSDWHQTAINHRADWYPLSIIRVISEVVKT